MHRELSVIACDDVRHPDLTEIADAFDQLVMHICFEEASLIRTFLHSLCYLWHALVLGAGKAVEDLKAATLTMTDRHFGNAFSEILLKGAYKRAQRCSKL